MLKNKIFIEKIKKMLIENIIRGVINEFVDEIDNDKIMNHWNNLPAKKRREGTKVFKKMAQKGIELNPMTDDDGTEFSWSKLLKLVPGVRYPRNDTETNTNNVALSSKEEEADDMIREIEYSLSLGNKKYKDQFLFAYGVYRMIYDKEVVTDLDRNVLSDICIYLSENPSEIKDGMTQKDMFNDKNWAEGIANFYGMSFAELKKRFGKDAKKYVSLRDKNNVIESKIVTSNGYYVYPCYTYGTANYIGNTFKQGMCFFNSPTFWQQHTGDSGALFMFKRINDYDSDELSDSGLYNDQKSFNEIVISTHINEDGEVYIDGITNGNNVTYYNADYHPANKLANSATDFSELDIRRTSEILGTINGEEVFEYCISRTERRQNEKYDEIFKNGNYEMYKNLSNKSPNDRIEDEEYNLTIFPDNGKVYCIDNNKQRVFLIEPKGFITCNGREVQNTDTPFYQRINSYMPKYYKDWNGFKHNKRNKYPYNESLIHKIILEEIEKLLVC